MDRDTIIAGEATLKNLNNINIILGRNGSGKSRFLRSIDTVIRKDPTFYVRYVSPERAGTFKRDGNILTQMTRNPNWLPESRSANQSPNFKAASALLLRDAELIYLRRLASTPNIRNDMSRDFVTDRLSKINAMLTNISLEMSPTDFEFRSLNKGTIIPPDEISSGESETVSLAAEIIYFFDTMAKDKFNVLLLDEPDVHLHPDLQFRLSKFIQAMIEEFSEFKNRMVVCVATHSAPLVCAFAGLRYVSIGRKIFDVNVVELSPISDELRKVAPFFGHPLSLSLNEEAPLIVEGEDDERVWQQAARTSQGRIKLFPVLASTVIQMKELEDFCVRLLQAIYDHPIAFSIRDGDGKLTETLDHCPPLMRFRINCYAIENLLVTDECLSLMGKNWTSFIEEARNWMKLNESHKYIDLVRLLVGSQSRLRHDKIKDVRNIICAICGSNKPWEVAVGQAIASIRQDDLQAPTMIVDYLGAELVKSAIFRQSKPRE